MSYTIVYKFNAKPGMSSDVLNAMQIVKGAAGLQSIDLYQEQADKHKIVSLEVWISQQHHDDFISAFTPEQNSDFMAMFSEPPKITEYQAVG